MLMGVFKPVGALSALGSPYHTQNCPRCNVHRWNPVDSYTVSFIHEEKQLIHIICTSMIYIINPNDLYHFKTWKDKISTEFIDIVFVHIKVLLRLNVLCLHDKLIRFDYMKKRGIRFIFHTFLFPCVIYYLTGVRDRDRVRVIVPGYRW